MLLEAKQKITQQAITDQLAGAFNRVKFAEVLDLELSKNSGRNKSITLEKS